MVTIFDEFAVGRTTVSNGVLDLSTVGICEIPVLKGICVDVFRELVSVTVCHVDVVSW